jgi:hypothetical protein
MNISHIIMSQYMLHIKPISLFYIYDNNGAFIICDWKRINTDSVPRPNDELAHAETPDAVLLNTFQRFFNTRTCFPYVWIKITSSNSVKNLLLPTMFACLHIFFAFLSLSLLAEIPFLSDSCDVTITTSYICSAHSVWKTQRYRK